MTAITHDFGVGIFDAERARRRERVRQLRTARRQGMAALRRLDVEAWREQP